MPWIPADNHVHLSATMIFRKQEEVQTQGTPPRLAPSGREWMHGRGNTPEQGPMRRDGSAGGMGTGCSPS